MQVMYMEYIAVTSYHRLLVTDSIDVELWNTFNSGNRGSRCYLKNGLYTRIDILDSGIVMFYEDLESPMATIANRIIGSAVISENKDRPVYNKRKKVPAIE